MNQINRPLWQTNQTKFLLKQMQIQLQLIEYLIQIKDNKYCSILKISKHFEVIGVILAYSCTGGSVG